MQPAKAGAFGAGRIIYSDTLQRFWVSCCPGGVKKATVCGDGDQKASGVLVCNQSWVYACVKQGPLSVLSEGTEY